MSRTTKSSVTAPSTSPSGANLHILAKIDPETGEEIPTTQAEKDAALEAFRGIFNGSFKLEFAPGVLPEGVTEDEVMAMLAEAVDRRN